MKVIPHPRLKQIRQATNEFSCEHAIYGVILRLTECLPSILYARKDQGIVSLLISTNLFCSSLIQVNKRRSWYGCAYGWRTHRFINCQLGTIWAEDIFVGNILIVPGGWVRGLVTQDSLKKVCLIHVVPDDCTHTLSFTFVSLLLGLLSGYPREIV